MGQRCPGHLGAMSHVCAPLTSLVQRFGDRVATACGDRRRTGRQLHGRVAALSMALRETLGVGPGVTVAIAALSTDRFFEAMLAVAACGGVLAPLNWRWSAREAAVAVEVVEASVLVVDQESLHFWSHLCEVCPSLRSGVVLCEGLPNGARRGDRLHSSEELIAAHPRAELRIATSPDGVAIICFTSGTTSSSKAVAISHAAFHSQSLAKLAVVRYGSGDVYLHTAPLFHIGGLSSALAMLMAGAVHVFMAKFSGRGAVEAIQETRVTALIAVPTMLVDMGAAAQGGSLPSVTKLLVGGGPMSAAHQDITTHLFPNATVTTAYGMTEACSSITFDGPFEPGSWRENRTEHGACAGVAAPGVELCIDTDVPGTEGEVLTRGPHTMTRYLGKPAATLAVLSPDGWLRTGDVGRLDAGGRLWLSGRKKDMIKTGGENVHASEVEAVVRSHPGVVDVAVVGVADVRLGELVAAVVSIADGWSWKNSSDGGSGSGAHKLGIWIGPREGRGPGRGPGARSKTLSIEGVQEACVRGGLARYKLPRVVAAWRAELPKTSSGKVKKGELRARLGAVLRRIPSKL
ncbi:unnamed protein product [Ostreobium quekettii]|uniref:AMP-dependent synthetase/ligase n=1 Tax=Ostreobium quekettii TaxID=121088 RepID=A0A8S1IQD7_9CHLO|nr:unnamed protein product [Ostreobium quekettii]|eukprot:evm.model.scf_60.16 EVM.evm.TU.scf_60.16   scf_60:123309-126565(+)